MKNVSLIFSLILSLCFALLFQLAALAQEENSRRFWPPEFRPQATTTNAKPRVGRYKSVTPRPVTIAQAEPATLGVTLWLMRTPEELKQATSGSRALSSNDEAARILLKKKVGNAERDQEVIPQRIQANTPLKQGQLLRLSVEVPQNGFLYVIDREKYADGKLSAPYLIYPSNPQGQEHAVKAGRTIELPGGDNVFEVKLHSEETHAALAGEVLSFIVTPKPLENLPRGNADESPIKLAEAQVAAWEKQWGKNMLVEQLELEKSAGQARTTTEQKALTNAAQTLKQGDPLPQTVFRLSLKRGNPFIVQLPLRIGK
ncbi:MAG: hypothetical protein HOP19_19425 [Acidobacteria bacterium]|nr:hypothetical protein [Acidobacteriota bacterium]